MAEEMKNQETMDDFAKEIDASFESFRDADMDIWEKLEKMKEDKTEFEVTIEGIVKGGAIAYVEGIRAFIPVSKLSLQYVEDPEEFLKKTLTVRVFDVNEEENNLVLSAREVLREKETLKGVKKSLTSKWAQFWKVLLRLCRTTALSLTWVTAYPAWSMYLRSTRRGSNPRKLYYL